MRKRDCKPFGQASETAVRLMLRYPWLMNLYYSMAIYECDDLPGKTLCTNGTSIWVDPGFWAQLNRDQRMTAIAHEIGHKMLLHPTRRGERDPSIFNIAGDHVINLMLTESGFTPLSDMVINGQQWSWFCDTKYKGWTTEQVYEDIWQELEGDGRLAEEKIGDAADLVDFGEGEAEGGETAQNFEQRIRKELHESQQMAHIAGNVPAWMKRALSNADYGKVNWYDVLEQFLRSLSVADYSWSRFSKREFVKTGVLSPDLWQPAMGGVAVFVDCSGSIDNAVMDVFNAHFKDILEQVKPKWTEVRYFETAVNHSLDHRFERSDFDCQLQPGGSGGTSFAWLDEEVAAMEEAPEVVLVLTDMYGDFGREPKVPTIWLSTSTISTAPFGEVVSIR